MRALPEKPDKLITIMGPSKTESLSGFRLGVGYGTPEIITRMEKLQAVVSLRCAGYNQAAFYRWFSEPDLSVISNTFLHPSIRLREPSVESCQN